jgi:hypothetical protein
METFNKTELLFSHIDNKINGMISKGESVESIVKNLQSTHDRFQEKVLNSKVMDSRFKYVYTHNQVAAKRIVDFGFASKLAEKNPKFRGLGANRLFKLIKLRDRLMKDKFEVKIDLSDCSKINHILEI